MSADGATQSNSPSQLANLALALSRHSALPSSKLIAVELSSAMAEVVRERNWPAFQGAVAQVKSDPLALEALLATGHLAVSRVCLNELQRGTELCVELAALPVVLEPSSLVHVVEIAHAEAMQRALESALPNGSRVRTADALLSEAEAFASPQRAQQLLDRLLEGRSVASMRAANTGKPAQARSKGALRFVPVIIIHQEQANPWRGRLSGELRDKLTQMVNARLGKDGQAARLRFGDLSRWTDARRAGHALYETVKVEMELARACHRLGITPSRLRAHLCATDAPGSLTLSFTRNGQEDAFLQRRFLSWSESYLADLVRELAQLAFAHGIAIHGDEQTSPLLEACMALSAVPRMVQALITQRRCFPGPESAMPQ